MARTLIDTERSGWKLLAKERMNGSNNYSIRAQHVKCGSIKSAYYSAWSSGKLRCACMAPKNVKTSGGVTYLLDMQSGIIQNLLRPVSEAVSSLDNNKLLAIHRGELHLFAANDLQGDASLVLEDMRPYLAARGVMAESYPGEAAERIAQLESELSMMRTADWVKAVPTVAMVRSGVAQPAVIEPAKEEPPPKGVEGVNYFKVQKNHMKFYWESAAAKEALLALQKKDAKALAWPPDLQQGDDFREHVYVPYPCSETHVWMEVLYLDQMSSHSRTFKSLVHSALDDPLETPTPQKPQKPPEKVTGKPHFYYAVYEPLEGVYTDRKSKPCATLDEAKALIVETVSEEWPDYALRVKVALAAPELFHYTVKSEGYSHMYKAGVTPP